MEADSTTFDDEGAKSLEFGNPRFPFNISPQNLKFYLANIHKKGPGSELLLVEWLQHLGLIPGTMSCPTKANSCKMNCRRARVVDRVQWQCESCSNRLSIRTNTFFKKISCSLRQILQMVLAWCEDADCQVASQYFGVKYPVANTIYVKLDDYAISQVKGTRLGGEDCVVVSQLYPDCINVRSPDTTAQKHTHQILMLADTKYVPTRYRLHVIKNNGAVRNLSRKDGKRALSKEITNVLQTVTDPQSLLLRGQHVPSDIGVSVLSLIQHADNEMQHFLSESMWRQAINLCLASRDICTKSNTELSCICAISVQRYLNVSLYRIQQGDGFYERMLRVIADSAA